MTFTIRYQSPVLERRRRDARRKKALQFFFLVIVATTLFSAARVAWWVHQGRPVPASVCRAAVGHEKWDKVYKDCTAQAAATYWKKNQHEHDALVFCTTLADDTFGCVDTETALAQAAPE